MAVRRFSVFAHCQAGFADWIAARKQFWILCAAFVKRDNSFSVIRIPNQVVNCFDVVAFIRKEGAFLQREGLIRSLQNEFDNGRVSDVCGRGQLVKRKARYAIDQHMAFIAPIKFIILFILLVGSRMNAKRTVRITVRITARMIVLVELVWLKGFWIVLCCVCQNRRGIQANKGRIYNAKLVELPNQSGHDLFQIAVFYALEKSVIGPIGRQRPHDIETAIMRNDSIVFQVIREICDLRKALAFHHDESAEHSFLWKTSPSCIGAGKLKVQYAEPLVIELDNAPGCEKAHILNQFLSVDRGQPLSGWFCLQLNYTSQGPCFLYL